MTLDELLMAVPEDVRKAVDAVCDRAGTFDADWCILKAAGELIAKPRLPSVSPEGLVEGTAYLMDFCGDKIRVWRSGINLVSDGRLTYKVCGETKLWGPIPEFELEGEA